MTLPRNFIASVWLAAALARVAVITAAVGQPLTAPAVPSAAMSAQPVPVPQLSNPDKLQSAGVVDSSGKAIGKVTEVKTGSDGKATRVKVALMTEAGQGRVASIRAEKLSYDQSKGVLVAQLSPAEVNQLATTSSTMSQAAGAHQQPGASQVGGKGGGY